MIFQEQQIDFLLWLKSLRGPLLDPIFYLFNWFDTGYFVLALVPAIWLGISRKWGIRAVYLASFGAMTSTIAKEIFAQPRPCHLVEELCMIPLKSYGFPSGGAENAIIVCGTLILYWKNRLAWPIGIFYFVMMSVSRLYLGVHFPLDILGGWILGALVLFVFHRTAEPIEAWAQKNQRLMAVLSIAIPLLGLAATIGTRFSFACEALTAAAIGIYLSRRFGQESRPFSSLRERMAWGLFGTLSTLGIYSFTQSAFATYLWISWVCPVTAYMTSSKRTS